MQGQEFSIDAILDTGYNGSLTLPPSLISELDLNWQRFGRGILADGSEGVFNIYEGIILWDGSPFLIDIDEMDADALVGMSLMYGYMNSQRRTGCRSRFRPSPLRFHQLTLKGEWNDTSYSSFIYHAVWRAAGRQRRAAG